MSYQTYLSRANPSYDLEVFSIGHIALNRISIDGRGRVHSVFPQAFNILNSWGQLVSIVGRNVGRGPINVVVELPPHSSMISLGVKRSQPVSICRESIQVQDISLQISMRNAMEWKPRKDFKRDLVTISEISQNLETTRKIANSHGSHKGLGELIDFTGSFSQEIPRNLRLNSFAKTAFPHLLALVNRIRQREYWSIVDSSEKLIGLGPGLTPSGDDVLAGLMISLKLFSLNLLPRPREISRVNNEIITILRRSPQPTTFLSREYLIHAAGGELNESIMNLVEKILTGKERDVVSATIGVLSIGETSGTDVVLGILLGSELVLDEVLS